MTFEHKLHGLQRTHVGATPTTRPAAPPPALDFSSSDAARSPPRKIATPGVQAYGGVGQKYPDVPPLPPPSPSRLSQADSWVQRSARTVSSHGRGSRPGGAAEPGRPRVYLDAMRYEL